jgi:drug/metabolite transporter (DMT)-like permease
MGMLLLSVLLLGTAWPVMKVLLRGATPLWAAADRAVLSAAVAFTLLAAMRRLRLPGRADLPIILSLGGLQIAVFFALSNLALRYVPAGRSVVLAYTTSLWLVPLSLLAGERIGWGRIGGVLLGMAGIAVLANPAAVDWNDAGAIAGHGFLLLAALSWALAIFHARHHAWHLTPLQILPWQMLLAAVLLTVWATLFEPAGHLDRSLSVALALGYLGVGGPIATWAATSVSRALPMLVSSIGFLGVPVLGVTVSSLWMGEPLTPSLMLGGLLILAGVALVAITGARGPR